MDALPHTQALLKELNQTAAEAGALLRDEAELFVRGIAQTLLLIPVLLFLGIGLWVAINFALSAITHAYTGSIAWAATSVLLIHVLAASVALLSLKRVSSRAFFPETRRALAALRAAS